MDFTVSQSVLSANLVLVSRAVPSRPTHPILACILMEADANTQAITLTGFDLSMGITVKFDAMVSESGRVAVPAKLFGDIIDKLRDDVSFTVQQEVKELVKINTAKITSGKSKYQITIQDTADFPRLPEIVEDQTVIKVPSITLVEGLQHTLFSASPDETKQIITGVNIKVLSEIIKFAATDGHRCTVYEAARHQEENSLPIIADTEIVDITVSTPTCQELKKAMAKATEKDIVEIVFNPSYLCATYGNYRIVARKLEGQYPNVEGLFPKRYIRKIEIDRKSLVAALERVAVMADQKHHIIRVTLDAKFPEEIFLSVKETEMGSGYETLNAKIESDTDFFMFALNVKYVLTGLAAMSSELVQIEIAGEVKPVVIRPVQSLAANMRYLVMPVQIR